MRFEFNSVFTSIRRFASPPRVVNFQFPLPWMLFVSLIRRPIKEPCKSQLLQVICQLLISEEQEDEVGRARIYNSSTSPQFNSPLLCTYRSFTAQFNNLERARIPVSGLASKTGNAKDISSSDENGR